MSLVARRNRSATSTALAVLTLTCRVYTTPGLPETKCGEAYVSTRQELAEFAGAQTRFQRPAHTGTVYSNIALDEGVMRPDGHDINNWIEFLFLRAHRDILACFIKNGRYWEVEFQPALYADSLPANVSKVFLARFRRRGGLLPEEAMVVRSSICTPAICEREDVETMVLPHYFGLLTGYAHALPFAGSGQLAAVELTHWNQMPMHFVIAGLTHCGTTSLRMNLLKHPDIGFTNGDLEDYFFGHIAQTRILPLKSQVHSFIKGVRKQWDEEGQHRPRSLGFANPMLVDSPLARHALLTIPKLRVIVIVCDPVSRLEKHFWTYHFCRQGETAEGRNGSRSISGGSCMRSIQEALHGHDLHMFTAKDVLEMRRLFGPDLFLLHQDQLRESPRRTYDAIASFLGVGHFPPQTQFERYNSNIGHRTDLCRNASLVRRFRKLHATAYQEFEDLLQLSGMPWASPRQRKTRCDRADELMDRQIS